MIGRKWPADCAPTLDSHFSDKQGLEDQYINGGGSCSLPHLSLCLNAGAMGRQDWETETLIPTTGGAFDCEPTCFHPTQDPISSTDGSTHAVSTGSGGWCATHAVCVSGQRSHALTTRSAACEEGGTGRGTPIVTHGGVFDCSVAFPINAGATSDMRPCVASAMQVRRLTPTECAYLQGFPADYLDVTFRKKPAADGPKYRALGNSMAVPCMWWLGYRIDKATQQDNP